MSQSGKDKERTETERRSQRLAAALRENLRRRKAQERGRASSTSEAKEAGTRDSSKERGR